MMNNGNTGEMKGGAKRVSARAQSASRNRGLSLSASHLTLREVNLRKSEEWKCADGGLSFLLLKDGKCKHAFRETTWDLLPGDVVVMNPETGGRVQGLGPDVVFWCFSVLFEHLFPLFSIEEIPLVQHLSESFRSSRLYEAASPPALRCQEIVKSIAPEGSMNHRGQVLHMAATVFSAEFSRARTERASKMNMEDHMRDVFESLSGDEFLTLSVGDLAKKFDCSRRHLNRLFHRRFGVPVAALRLEMRLLKAAALLRDQEVKIVNVSRQSGFNHQSRFNSQFKKRFGSTPDKWRKSVAQNSMQMGSLDKQLTA